MADEYVSKMGHGYGNGVLGRADGGRVPAGAIGHGEGGAQQLHHALRRLRRGLYRGLPTAPRSLCGQTFLLGLAGTDALSFLIPPPTMNDR